MVCRAPDLSAAQHRWRPPGLRGVVRPAALHAADHIPVGPRNSDWRPEQWFRTALYATSPAPAAAVPTRARVMVQNGSKPIG